MVCVNAVKQGPLHLEEPVANECVPVDAGADNLVVEPVVVKLVVEEPGGEVDAEEAHDVGVVGEVVAPRAVYLMLVPVAGGGGGVGAEGVVEAWESAQDVSADMLHVDVQVLGVKFGVKVIFNEALSCQHSVDIIFLLLGEPGVAPVAGVLEVALVSAGVRRQSVGKVNVAALANGPDGFDDLSVGPDAGEGGAVVAVFEAQARKVAEGHRLGVEAVVVGQPLAETMVKASLLVCVKVKHALDNSILEGGNRVFINRVFINRVFAASLALWKASQ